MSGYDEGLAYTPETPKTIGEWGDSVFGLATDRRRTIERASEEFAELIVALEEGASDATLCQEAADVCIVLMRMLNSLGFPDMINIKMAVNRGRSWEVDGNGHGYHRKFEEA